MGCTQLYKRKLELTRWASDHLSSSLPPTAPVGESCSVGPSSPHRASQNYRRKSLAGHWHVVCRTQTNYHCSVFSPLSRNVSKLIQRCRIKQHVRPGVSTGRPKKTSVQDDRLLYRMCRQGRFKFTRTIMDQGQRSINLRVACSTVNQRLLSRSLHSRLPPPPRNLCWPTSGREPAWNRPIGTNMADWVSGGMSSSLINSGIFFIVLMADFMCVVNVARDSTKTVFAPLWPTEGAQCMFGLPSTIEPT